MAANSKSRMITFRIPSEDYEQFRELCINRGVKNVSELVRAAVNKLLIDSNSHSVEDNLEVRVARLELRIQALMGEMHRMQGERSGAVASAASASAGL
jgi:Arc/MetJ-type ribon-helix-helix transcriptional regulator